MTTPDGLLLVDKPRGLTSHDVVARVRKAARIRRVGHAGTLDPMATGLLVLGLGKATRLLTHLVGADKTYEATIRLGQTTDTEDADGEISSSQGADLTVDQISPHVHKFTGRIDQVPSAVSAIKVDGKRAYERVRAGQDVKLPARPVTIHEFQLGAVNHAQGEDGVPLTDVQVQIRCSSGTYIRALARDLGDSLGVGAHLIALRRAGVGPFDIAQAGPCPVQGEDLLSSPSFFPLAQALMATFPLRVASEVEAQALSYGQPIDASAVDDGVVGVLDPHGRAIAVVQNSDGKAKPVIVFTPA